ncbi:MAG: hypothetical protein U0528_08630 [Anaerolineae bacterium]|nr:hypothetical protein [Anaerolineae bacterium]
MPVKSTIRLPEIYIRNMQHPDFKQVYITQKPTATARRVLVTNVWFTEAEVVSVADHPGENIEEIYVENRESLPPRLR